MEDRTLIMPFRIIVIQKPPFAKENVQFYDKTGRPLYSMFLPQNQFGAEVLDEFTESIYTDLISIQDKEDARSFVAAHPTLRFVWKNTINIPFLADYLTEEDYYSCMVDSVKEYNDIRKLILTIEKYLRENNSMYIEEMEKLFSLHLGLFGENEDSWYENKGYYAGGIETSLDAYDDAHQAFLNSNSEKTDYDEREEDEFVQQYLADHSTEVTEKHKNDNHKFAEYMIGAVFAFVQKITDRANIAYSIDSRMLECRCHDLYTAMYLMTFVSIHNENEYRKCANPKCHHYFLVDKIHPQTLCDVHMAPRRRKRKGLQEEDKKDREKNYYRPRGEKK